jgi:hypothetical protein
MLGDSFVKIFKLIKILYNLYKILVIFKIIYFYPIEFERIILEKKWKLANLFWEKST